MGLGQFCDSFCQRPPLFCPHDFHFRAAVYDVFAYFELLHFDLITPSIVLERRASHEITQ